MSKFSFEITETGSGPAVLMLPGSYATPAAWRGIQAHLTRSYRLLSTSLPGYGTTPEIRPDDDPDIRYLVEFVGQVIDDVNEPVHLVGHSWGAQLALAAILHDRVAPLSLLCFEANPIFARSSGKAFHWRADIETLVETFQTALDTENRDAAGIIIDFYSRPGAFLAMPEKVQAFCRATAATNLRDWRSAATFTPTFEEFGAFSMPVTLVHGHNTPQAIVDVTEALAAHIPNARHEVVEGADHFLISTHPEACADILETHISMSGSKPSN